MVDWLLVWGVNTVAGFVFTEVLAPLAKGALDDYVKDFFKDSIKDFTGLFQKDILQTVVGKALKEFLQLVQQELEDAEISEEQLPAYTTPFNQFINDKSVKEILGSAFQYDCQAINIKKLSITWYQLDLLSLPEGFDWEQIGKRYLKKVKAIIRESDELRAILDSQNLEAIQQSTKELAGIPTEFDLRRYQEGLQERYANLNLDSLDTTVYDYREKLKVWQVFIAQDVRECQEYLPQVYEIPKEHQKRLRESNQLEADVNPEGWERYKEVYYQQPIRSVLDIVNDYQTYPYVVILGDPGSGKSTLLQYIALNWARTPLNNVIEESIPLLIELRAYIRNRDSGECKDFLEFFHKGCGIVCRLNQHELHERLRTGKVLVMFDGLDEVFDPAKREEVITDIHRFTNEYPKARVIVTSRIIGYKPQRLRDAQFRHFMLQDLESEQIEDFLYRWHGLTFTDEADKVRKQERLQQAIKKSSAIGELAGNPLLLTMMAILNRNQELPRDRPELYNQASRLLLHQWDVEQKLLENPRVDSVTIDYKDKQAILRQVAYQMQASEKSLAGNLISADDLEKVLTDYLKTIEVEQARTVTRLLIEQLRHRNFILCFLGADYYAFVHRTFLEYFCASEFVWQFEKERSLSLEELKTEVFGKHWQDESWHEVLRLIAGMIDTSFAGQTIDYLMALNGEAKKFINLLLAAKCLSDVRNRSAITATASKLLNHLKDLTTQVSVNFVVRQQAVSAIATTWKEELETLTWLKTLAQSTDEMDTYVRYIAVGEVANGWKDNPANLLWLKTCACSRDWRVQQVAVQQIARDWRDHSDTLSWLKALTQIDNTLNVQYIAVMELARGWKNDLDTLSILKSNALSGKNWEERYVAVNELAKGWKDEPGMFEFLCDRALKDPFERKEDKQYNPRQIALEGIIKNYADHPQTLTLLRDRAENDLDEKVREFASKKLKELDN
ncbi:NACHT domain-containing protein [Coleofasciculus sp. FACHB-1120]|uniref:NACHT domain-containing protein n=1 Tax=Coleofasciculus sp. FACHB-1120 TaxID=2692783 RepID=UPI0016831BEB|nr:NACHT domain-containing protein [Coleofasciculus sp. FACHB-1120]MBD2740254.1 NACHT domain-containing protein [Coleofasciculus sp. FACHB-1120]